MADTRRLDAQGGLYVDVPAAAGAKEPVQLTAGGTLSIEEPGPSMWVPFGRNAVAAAGASLATNTPHSTTNVAEFKLPQAFRVIGITIASPSNLSAGTFTAAVRKGGTSVGTLTLAVGSKHASTWLGWRAGYQFASTDVLTVTYDTDGSFSPSQNIFTHLLIALRP